MGIIPGEFVFVDISYRWEVHSSTFEVCIVISNDWSTVRYPLKSSLDNAQNASPWIKLNKSIKIIDKVCK